MQRDTKNLPVPTAKDINEAHRLARSSAETAVEWAVKCGQLLAAKKDSLGHGNWESWVESNCKFTSRSASAYMKVAVKQAQIGSALPISSIRQAIEEDRPKPEPRTFTPKGAVSVVNPKGTEETGDDRPAALILAAKAKPEKPAAPEVDERWQPEEDEGAQLEQAEKEYAASIDKVMAADDKLTAAHAEIKRQAAEIASLKLSRNGYQNQCSELIRRIKALQRESDKAKRRAA